MSISESVVESRQQVSLDGGSAVICWIKDPNKLPPDIDFELEPVTQRQFGQRFDTGIKTIGKYLKNIF